MGVKSVRATPARSRRKAEAAGGMAEVRRTTKAAAERTESWDAAELLAEMNSRIDVAEQRIDRVLEHLG